MLRDLWCRINALYTLTASLLRSDAPIKRLKFVRVGHDAARPQHALEEAQIGIRDGSIAATRWHGPRPAQLLKGGEQPASRLGCAPPHDLGTPAMPNCL